MLLDMAIRKGQEGYGIHFYIQQNRIGPFELA